MAWPGSLLDFSGSFGTRFCSLRFTTYGPESRILFVGGVKVEVVSGNVESLYVFNVLTLLFFDGI